MNGGHNKTGLEIAVIGMAGKFPGAKNIDQFWDNLKNGVESITFYSDQELLDAGINPELLENPYYVKSGGGILEDKEYFDASFFGYSGVEAEMMDPQVRVFHECAWHALENAGYDSFSFDGLIGIYAGASFNLSWEALSWLSGRIDILGDFTAGLLIDRDFLCTRVSYNLNLKGPSVIVKTACSTSLTAVHMACQAILNGECDIALAGGVSITQLKKSGSLYQEDMIASQDGHCRAFDVMAKGTVGGDGVGIVVLKRLEEAINDGDQIHAVIKGTAINNDGNRKAGYTAPSIIGQSEVICDALQISEIEPETIAYVETHGTGTVVGDPLEIEALKMAFDTDKKGFCCIGSVKTNVGHLDSAAGITGLIKVILALKFKLIPPSLNFEIPNPKIDFENSPFYVITELSEWKSNGYPLRAGVSSFGIGGTNAHVVLEEAPKIESSSESRAWKLLVLYAKTQSALERASTNLLEFLKNNPNINLADAAYTLQVGRKAFPYRQMLVCSDVEGTIDALSSTETGKLRTFYSKDEKKSVVFMFPGLGSQYVNMGVDLYKTEPVFQQEMDRCFEILNTLVDYDIKSILYPVLQTTTSPLTGHPSQEGNVGGYINRIEIAQPVVFIFEFALAKLLMRWGITPHAMIGYSFGEYTAACLSGVFSLEDALKLIVIRGQLIGRVTAGSMLSVPLPVKELKPLLNNELSIAIDNGPSCIVAGPDDIIDVFDKQLKAKRYLGMKLPNSQAIHSKMMEPLLKEFEEHVRQVKLNRPQIPYISNVTGKWITVQEAVDPAYWSRHLRETVRFADGINEVKKEPNAIFIEIGPGRDLSVLLVRHKEDDSKLQVVNLIRPLQKDVGDDRFLLSKIGQLCLYGVTMDWREFYSREKRHRIPLPTYSFDQKRYWFEGDPLRDGEEMRFRQSLPPKKTDVADWFYIPQWNRAALPVNADTSISESQRCWLLFMDESALGTHLVERLKMNNSSRHVIIVRPGSTFKVLNKHEFTINPLKSNDYNMLFKELVKSRNVPDDIVHFWSLTGNGKSKHKVIPLEELDRTLDFGLYSLVNIVQAVGNNSISHDMRFGIITDNMLPVTGEEDLCPEKATILGPVKIIPMEYPNIKCLSIDIINPGSNKQKVDFIIDNLLREFSADFLDYRVVAYRGTYRWIESFEPIKLDSIPSKKPGLKKKGVYLVTGGLGGMGFALAENLARTLKARLILVDILDPPPGEKLDEWLTSHHRKNDIRLKEQKIKELGEMGVEIHIHNADVSNYHQMKEVILKSEERFGKINGVIHTAGLIDYAGVIQRRTRQMTEEILAAKVRGTLILDELLKDHELNFMVLFSSIGNIFYQLKFGQAGYNAGHEFLDVFTYYKQKEGIFTVTIDWNDWLEKGMAVRAAAKGNPSNNEASFNINEDILSISPSEGIDVFNRILENDFRRVIVSTRDLGRMVEFINNHRHEDAEKVDLLKDRKAVGSLDERPELSTTYVAPSNETEQYLANIWHKFFGIKQVGINDDFFELGGDSLKAITLTSQMHKEFNVLVPMTEMFNTPTIKGISGYIKAAKQDRYASIEVVEKKEYYPMSSAQKRLYILHQMHVENTGYNLIETILTEGELKRSKLEDTFCKLINRHESLRTSFDMIEGEPVQKIHDKVEFEIEYNEVKVQTENEKGSGESMYSPLEVKEIIKNFVRPFNLSRAPLLRVGLIRVQEEKHILMVDMHHIISDGISLTIFLKDFMSLNEGKELPGLRLQYKNFSEWQNKLLKYGEINKQEDYWLKQFEGEIPVLSLPLDYSRHSIRSFQGSGLSFEIGEKDTMLLNRMAFEQKTTLYMVLISIYNILLSKISGQEDIVTGTPVAGRIHPDIEQIIGIFINMLALRNQPEGEKPFAEFLQDVRKITLNGFENQNYQFEDLVEKAAVNRDKSRHPLFNVIFVMQNMERPEVEIPGLRLIPYEHGNNSERFDLTLVVLEVRGKLHFVFEYSTELFKKETIERFSNYLKKIVLEVIEAPKTKIWKIEILSGEEKRQLLYNFNNTGKEYYKNNTLHQLFVEQVEKTPDTIVAISMATGHRYGVGDIKTNDSQYMSYNELNKRSHQLAYILRSNGVKPDSIVGIMIERSIEMVEGIISILKAGGAYLPINFDHPQKRKKFLLEDSGVQVLLTRKHLLNKDKESFEHSQWSNLLFIDIDDTDTYFGEDSLPEIVNTPKNLAYVIYTSGTTGKPKGVIVEHRNVVTNIFAFYREFDICPSDTVIQLASYTFDIFSEELFPIILKGGKIAIPVRSEMMDVKILMDLIARYQVNIIDCTPLLLNEFNRLCTAEGPDSPLESVHTFISGGDVLKGEYVDKLMEMGRVYNTYGPTETTVSASYYKCTDAGKTNIPIGSPISNYSIYILDKYDGLQPIGIIGELCVSGAGVTRGYLNNPELTAEKFISSPLTYHPSRIYKTGDLARWLPDGNIEFSGRIDHQVKIRGFRIELGEIESRLLNHGGIKEAVVLAPEEEKGDKYLCGYIVSDNELVMSELREYLAKELPDYMVPSFFVQLERIPLTPNGKIDNNALPAPQVSIKGEFTAPGNEVEKTIAKIWKEVLKLDKVGKYDNLFDVGGNSLKIIHINSKLRETFNRDIPVTSLFEYTTINTLAQFLQQEGIDENSFDFEIDRTEQISEGAVRLTQRMQRRGGIEND